MFLVYYMVLGLILAIVRILRASVQSQVKANSDNFVLWRTQPTQLQ